MKGASPNNGTRDARGGRTVLIPLKFVGWQDLKNGAFHSEIGRAGGIRTRGLLVPNEALYQAEPRPDCVISTVSGSLRLRRIPA